MSTDPNYTGESSERRGRLRPLTVSLIVAAVAVGGLMAASLAEAGAGWFGGWRHGHCRAESCGHGFDAERARDHAAFATGWVLRHVDASDEQEERIQGMRLQRQVDDLGSGDLSARVEVEGNDEVADLARSFNRAADQIESLLDAKRSLLASASHELRTPLARIRVAVELLGVEARPDLQARIAQDIAELDELIGELLLASRLDTTEPRLHFESIDLLALVAEEAAHSEANVEGEATEVRGDRRMLRRLVRNLLENAGRYGGGSAIDVRLERLGEAGARLRVCDRGAGVAAEDRERIFEPFYRPSGASDAGDRGVGLGLSLVQQIARHHGGEASYQSRAGGGSCFEVRLWACASVRSSSGAC